MTVVYLRTLQSFSDVDFSTGARVKDFPAVLSRVPRESGVYLIVRDTTELPRFNETRDAKPFKGKPPVVDADALKAKWVPAAHVIYIGKSNNLYKRLRTLLRFGQGEAAAHWGGRYLWQLTDAAELRICWQPDSDHTALRGELLRVFKQQFGCLPFANLMDTSKASPGE